LQANDKLRLGVIIGGAVISIALLAVGVLLIRAAFSPAARAGDITPAGPDEFLILVAPFQHKGGEYYDFGAELANDLRQTPHYQGAYRVENLAEAPSEKAIPQLAQTYHARVILTGVYDESNIDAWVYFIPPDALPPLASDSEGRSLLISDFAPIRYHVYAPRGLGHPLQYLQYWIIGQTHFWRGEYDEALGAFELSQRLLPTVTPVDRRTDMDRFVSSLLWAQGYITGPVKADWPVARDFFYRSVARDPHSLAAVLGLAASLAQLNEPDRAIDILQAALREYPNAWQIYFALAEIKAQQGKGDEALALYQQAIDLLSTTNRPVDQQALADIYFNRGYYYYQQGDLTRALADYQQARALECNDIYLLSNLGWTAYLLGDYETAVEASSQAAELAPNRPDLAFNKALHLLAAGRYDEAKETYDKAIQLTLQYDDALVRSRYFGAAYYDLQELAARRPDLQPIISEIQEKIDIANG
jgi:tetratricopeptide (TPR) repeat protein